MLNGDSVDPLTFVSHRTNAQKESRVVCKKLKETLPREQFVIKIQVSQLFARFADRVAKFYFSIGKS